MISLTPVKYTKKIRNFFVDYLNPNYFNQMATVDKTNITYNLWDIKHKKRVYR